MAATCADVKHRQVALTTHFPHSLPSRLLSPPLSFLFLKLPLSSCHAPYAPPLLIVSIPLYSYSRPSPSPCPYAYSPRFAARAFLVRRLPRRTTLPVSASAPAYNGGLYPEASLWMWRRRAGEKSTEAKADARLGRKAQTFGDRTGGGGVKEGVRKRRRRREALQFPEALAAPRLFGLRRAI